MRVRMLTTAAGPAGVYVAGETWDVASDTGQQLIAGGYAVAAAAVAPETATAPVPAETAVMPRAVKRRPTGS